MGARLNLQLDQLKKRIGRVGILLALFLLAMPVRAATVTVSSSTSWATGLNSGADVVVTGSGTVLTLGSSYSFNSLTIQSGASVVTTYGVGVTITVATDVSIDATSSLNGDARGASGGSATSTGTSGGTGGGGSGAFSGAGGGYGGAGGACSTGASGGLANGSAAQPTFVGSGGGGATSSWGGYGGGAIKLIVTGTLTVNGNLSANGGPGVVGGTASSGGGSGGGLWLQAGTLTGSGNILAKGGDAPAATNRGGGGGGGRIVMYYTTNSFAGTVSADGGVGNVSGNQGSYLLIDGSRNASCGQSGNLTYDPTTAPPSGINNMTINNSCNLVLTSGSSLNISGDLSVASGSSINADGVGGTTGTNSTMQPTYPGGTAYSGAGGAIKIVVDGTTTIDGTLSASGVSGTGAGGAIWLKTGGFAGGGSVKAISFSASGQAGAIAIYYSGTNSFAGTVNLSSTTTTAIGSLFFQNYSTGDLSCPFSGVSTWYNPSNTLPSYATAIRNFSITNGCKYGFKFQATTTSASQTITGDMTIDSTSYFWEDGMGAAGGFSLSAGTAGGTGGGGVGSSAGGGGGYGGAGGISAYLTAGGTINGTWTQPTNLGSGGGGANSSAGGGGGGALKLIVAGTLTVNGSITANGNPGVVGGSYSSGGGSGGSVWLQAGTLAGNGTISAKGGDSPAATNRGGGGGGGRIVIYYTTNSYTGSINISGGAGYLSGGKAGSYWMVDGSNNIMCASATSNSFDPATYPTGGINNMTISGGCSVIVLNNTALNVSGDLTVAASSSLNADGVGGTTGTNSTMQPTYSGGLATTYSGGAMKIVVDGATTINGTLSSSGTSGTGAGGAIWLKTGTLAGNGTIQANPYVSTGAAGAIAIYHGGSTFSGSINLSTTSTSIGSLFFQNFSNGDLSCDFSGLTAFFNPSNSLPSYAAAIRNVSLTNGCKYGFKFQGTGTSNVLTITGDMTIDSSSYFWADGMGNSGGFSSGNGSPSTAGGGYGAYSGSGGGHGGVGGASSHTSSVGAINGSGTQPVTMGGGGGGATSSGGGYGGGAIKLIVPGTLTVNGFISANGGSGTVGGTASSGGGAGGSIWLQVGTLTGNGTLTVKGGDAPVATNRGGGGGGGRIAIYYTTNSFSGTINTAGGAGNASGASGSYFTMDSTNNLNCTNAVTSYYDPTSPPAGGINNVTISGGCNFVILNNTAMNISGDLTIGSGSSMNADGVGGTTGTNSTMQPTYAGGTATSYSGGAIKLVVDGTTTINGTLSVNGTSGTGAGGAIWLKTGNLAGSGAISANPYSAAGTAGAVAIYYATNNTYAGTLSVASTMVSSNGSLFLQNYSNGDVSCPFATTTAYFNPSNTLPSYAAAIRNFSITNGCKYGFKYQATGTAATVSITGDLTIDSSSYFWADGLGYSGGFSSGNGSPSTAGGGYGAYSGSGGGHGGAGGPSAHTSSVGSTNDSATQPVALGSGGGGSNSTVGGAGGGALKLVVAGTMTINGTISANGAAGTIGGTASSGGGAGGSIWLQSTTLAGNGSILAKGGNAPSTTYQGGGGGGGRIALYYTTKTFSGTISVAPGTGYTTGGVIGTIAGLNPATKLIFSTQPSTTGTVGTNFATQPVLQAQDSSNAIDVNYVTDVTLTAYTDASCTTLFSGATVAGSPKTPTNGVATFSGVNVNKYNGGVAIYLKATSGSLTTACSTGIVLNIGSATVLVFTTQPSTTNTAGTNFSTVPVVQAQDGYGDKVSSYVTSVALSVYSDNTCTTAVVGGTLTGTPVTPTTGQATFTGTNYTKAGTGFYFKATSGALTSGCSQSFDVLPAAASQLTYTTQPSSTGLAGVNLAQQPTVAVTDAYGNSITTDTGNVVVIGAYTDAACTTGAAGGTLSGSATTTLGSAPFSGVNYTKVGTIYMKSTVSGFSGCSTSITISAGTATQLAFKTQPPSMAQPSTNFTTSPVVTVQDAYGNTVTSSAAVVSLAADTDAGCTTPASGSLTSSPSAISSGDTTFASTQYNTSGKIYLNATASGLTAACSSMVNVISSVPMFFRGY